MMAGGGAPVLDPDQKDAHESRDDAAFLKFIDERLGEKLPQMAPRDEATSDGTWCLAGENAPCLLYSLRGNAIHLSRYLDLALATGVWFNPRTGQTSPANLGNGRTIAKPTDEAWLLLIQNEKREGREPK